MASYYAINSALRVRLAGEPFVRRERQGLEVVCANTRDPRRVDLSLMARTNDAQSTRVALMNRDRIHPVCGQTFGIFFARYNHYARCDLGKVVMGATN